MIKHSLKRSRNMKELGERSVQNKFLILLMLCQNRNKIWNTYIGRIARLEILFIFSWDQAENLFRVIRKG